MNGIRTFIRQLAGLGAAALLAAPAVQATTLTVSQWLPAGHPVHGVMQAWSQKVEQATQGRVTFKTLPQPVTNPQGHYNAVRDGLAEVAMTVIGYTPGRFPLSEIAELPLMGESAEANSVAFQQLAEKVPAVMAEYKDVKVLALFSHGPGTVFNTKKDIRTLADLQGLKFRVGGGVVNEVGKLLGANTTLKPATESYELLSTGVMDGVWLPWESLVTYKLDKLVRHATVFPGGLYNSTFIVMMNKRAYDGLSAADKAEIDKLSGVPYARELGRAFDRRDAEGKALAQASGIKTSAAPAELVKEVENRTASLNKRWADLARSKGVSDPEQIVQDYRAQARKP
jgi:TRAP-type C4-dicarboxylate transport system substrate-binding protein